MSKWVNNKMEPGAQATGRVACSSTLEHGFLVIHIVELFMKLGTGI